jgi:hypothetical protein
MAAGPRRDLRDALFQLYVEADRPTLEDVAALLASDDDLPGSPGKDVIHRILSGRAGPATQQDTVSVAVALSRIAGRGDGGVLADNVRRLWVAAEMAPPPPPVARLGRPVRECDPIALEVHRAIDLPGGDQSSSMLPAYVPRAHDARLTEIVTAAADGVSGLALLIGESSTGKTRACWEAIQSLPDRWRVWHPIEPSRPDATAAALAEVGPHTVVWLNEAQEYLRTSDHAVGERIAAGLRALLADPTRAPVLVLATLWPEHWWTLASRPARGDVDAHAQARELLAAGSDLRVPDMFSATDLQTLRQAAAGDPRLAHAAAQAERGRITQHLAGVPALAARYRNAMPTARAVIEVAIDLRRLGHPPSIPRRVLEEAAPGYLDDHDWDLAGDAWLDQALDYTGTPCHGVPGPLSRIRPRPGAEIPDGPCYRLADHVDQVGRTVRAGVFPPASFWAAAASIGDVAVLREFGRQADRRGRHQRGVQMYRLAAGRGDTAALRALARRRLWTGDADGAQTLYQDAVVRGDTPALLDLAMLREQAGDTAGAQDLTIRATLAGLPLALTMLASRRTDLGDAAGVEALYREAADRGINFALRELGLLRERAGDDAGAATLYREAAHREAAYQEETDALRQRLLERKGTGDTVGAEILNRQVSDRAAVAFGNVHALRDLMRLRGWDDDIADIEVLAVRAADCGDTGPLRELADRRRDAGDHARAEALYRQLADRRDFTPPWDPAEWRERVVPATDTATPSRHDAREAERLLGSAWRREHAGDLTGAAALAVQAAERGNDTYALHALARHRAGAGDPTGAEVLYRHAIDRGDASAVVALARLRQESGDTVGGNRILQFGLTDDGAVATSIDF